MREKPTGQTAQIVHHNQKKTWVSLEKKHVEIQIYKSQDVQQMASLKNMYTPEN